MPSRLGSLGPEAWHIQTLKPSPRSTGGKSPVGPEYLRSGTIHHNRDGPEQVEHCDTPQRPYEDRSLVGQAMRGTRLEKRVRSCHSKISTVGTIASVSAATFGLAVCQDRCISIRGIFPLAEARHACPSGDVDELC